MTQTVPEMASEFGMDVRPRNDGIEGWVFTRGDFNMIVHESHPNVLGIRSAHECLLDAERVHYANNLSRIPLAELKSLGSDMCVLVNYQAMTLIEEQIEPAGVSQFSHRDGAPFCGDARVYWEPRFEENNTDDPVAAIALASECQRFYE